MDVTVELRPVADVAPDDRVFTDRRVVAVTLVVDAVTLTFDDGTTVTHAVDDTVPVVIPVDADPPPPSVRRGKGRIA